MQIIIVVQIQHIVLYKSAEGNYTIILVKILTFYILLYSLLLHVNLFLLEIFNYFFIKSKI